MESKPHRSSQVPECRICTDWKPYCVHFSLKLGKLRKAAFSNCTRCRFLVECVKPYQQHWSHLGDAEAEKVSVILSRSIISTDSLFRVTLQWQCQDGKPRQLEIQIAAEVRPGVCQTVSHVNSATSRMLMIYPGPNLALPISLPPVPMGE